MIKQALEELHVLVVEDESFMRSLICRLLYEIQIGKTTDVDNGKDGIKALSIGSAQVDVILLDIQMPDMNGLEFLQLIRNSKEILQNPDVPVIMLTGNADEEIVKHALSLGVHGYLLKPVSKKAMLTRLLHAIAKP